MGVVSINGAQETIALPDGWRMGTLSELCSLVSEQCDPTKTHHQIYVGLEHIDSGAFTFSRCGSPKDVVSAKNRFEKDDILYGKLRPYLDKAVLADREGICSTDILVFRPHKGVCPLFVLALIHSKPFVDYAIQTTHGVNHPRTSWTSLKDFEHPVAPLIEQKRIAAVLWKIQKAIEIEDSIVRNARDLKKSLLRRLFTHGLRGEPLKETEIGPLPESWEVVPFEQVLTMAQYGLSIRGQAQGKYPILRMNCQVDGQIHFDDLQYVDVDEETFRLYELQDGDLLFNRTNSHELVGRTVVFHAERPAVFASYLIRLRLDKGQMSPDFVNYYLGMDSTQQALKLLAARAVSQSNISASKLKTFLIPKPGKDEQREIAGILQTVDRKIEVHESKKRALQDLFKTMLHKLMTAQIRVNTLDIDTSEVEVPV